MQVTNIRGHRIRWRVLFAGGAVTGLVSALVMLAIAMLLYPLFAAGADAWSFPRAASSLLLGADAVEPLAGFAATPVLVGLLVHFTIGTLAGITYAAFVAMFDLEGWTPVALFGLLYGAMLFVWSTALVGAGVTPLTGEQFPLVVMFWANLAFGLSAGALLASWADRADLDQADDERIPVFEGQQDRGRVLH